MGSAGEAEQKGNPIASRKRLAKSSPLELAGTCAMALAVSLLLGDLGGVHLLGERRALGEEAPALMPSAAGESASLAAGTGVAAARSLLNVGMKRGRTSVNP